MKTLLWRLAVAAMCMQNAMANMTHPPIPVKAPQPTSCIASEFITQGKGNKHWKNINLKLTNRCEQAVDFQNVAVSFQNGTHLDTDFRGNFSPLSYPDNDLHITSQAQADGSFLASLSLHFPTHKRAKTLLPVGRTITIKYRAMDDYVAGSVQVYLNTTLGTGNIAITNATAKPNQVTENTTLVHLMSNGKNVSDIQLPWQASETISGLSAGNYTLSAENVSDSAGTVYQASVAPTTIQVVSDQTAQATVTYAAVQTTGGVSIELSALPNELAGYTEKPLATITNIATGSATSATLAWGAATAVNQLVAENKYGFSTPSISFKGYQCTPSFTPTELVAARTNLPITKLNYRCQTSQATTITLNVTGAPTSLAELPITLTPSNNTPALAKTVSLTNGSGTDTVAAAAGSIYQVSAAPVAGYSIQFSPQPITATANAIETIRLTQTATGTPVSINGQLKTCANQLCNQHNQPIQLKGMSSHGLQWYGLNKCLTTASMDALAKDFGANVMRISMYIQEGGYETDPAGFTQQVNQLIEEATKRGLYAVIDWHMLTPGDPNINLARAEKFFTEIATLHKNKVNLIYEIANEPNGVSWSSIKSYAEKLIPVIRAIDPNTVIVVGTPGWSSLGVSDGKNSQEIINQPVNFPNIMYAFHFYANSHREQYLNELDKASNALPIFVTEWGTQTYSGDGENDFAMSDKYIQLMNTKKISWTSWNYSDDFRSGAIWKVGTCSNGPWTDANLKPAGIWIKDKIKN